MAKTWECDTQLPRDVYRVKQRSCISHWQNVVQFWDIFLLIHMLRIVVCGWFLLGTL